MDCIVNTNGFRQKPSMAFAFGIFYSICRNFDIYTDFRVAWDIYNIDCIKAHKETEIYID